MTSLLGHLAQVLTAAAFLASALALIATRTWPCALAVLLDLLLAAGLLRLAAPPTWTATASAAGILLVRQIAVRTLRRTAGRWRTPGR